jgi:hypothetical protein
MKEHLEYSMVQEACDSYKVVTLPDGRTEIRNVIPERFRDLWLTKLSELRGTQSELADGEGKLRAE